MDNKIISTAAVLMSDKDFRRISEVIQGRFGIKMPPEKKVLLESRLHKRLHALGMKSYEEYFHYLFEMNGLNTEIIDLMNAVSTNKTDFFRENSHFDFLASDVVPEILSRTPRNSRKLITIWSSASSSGEEPYTIAMVMSEMMEKFRPVYPLFDFAILATDISTVKLEEGKRAIYSDLSIEQIPVFYRQKYLLKSKDPSRSEYRIIPELRTRVLFHRLNLMDEVYPIDDPIDILFCRNVLIYFSKEVQEAIINRFYRNLAPGGYLFIGHSETLINRELPYVQKAPTVYRRKDE